jgi:hypothetical protein
MIRIRIFQALFFFPCCLIDCLGLLLVNAPMWILTGVPIISKESYIEWLLDLEKNINDK